MSDGGSEPFCADWGLPEPMPDLATWANVAEIVGGATVVGGVILALFQLHRYRTERRREALLTLMRAFQTYEWVRAGRVIGDLPDGVSYEEMQERPEEDRNAVWFHMATWESLGVMVNRGEVPLDLVEDFYSGMIQVSWRKLERYVEESREALDRETYFEWFQWLAERIEEREAATPPEPAHVAHADWTT